MNNEGIQYLVNLRTLNLSYSSCGFKGYSKLIDLTTLKLYHSIDPSHVSIDHELRLMTSLTSLSLLFEKEVSNVGIETLTNLREFRIDNDNENNKINDESIMKLSLLTHLTVNRNLSDVGIMNLSNLVYLDISNEKWFSKITNLCLKNLSFLTHLNVNDNNNISKRLCDPRNRY